jgi:hypothetical protein
MKMIEAQQAKLCNTNKNTRLKLLKTNAAIWFNKMRRIKLLKPNYINIKTNGKKPRDRKTCINSTIKSMILLMHGATIKIKKRARGLFGGSFPCLHRKC